ncbi:CD164 sialomucin-like 2 protein isoform X3 [Scyliorhinus canicula]|uniref:CD164 sialomucin-like 2 protein isoform X3 n=1 Tax=Scyliorhinus canicula TaxID=7830 RepID=UPI0018F2A43D|nr:CD164 sialomucin-like 2 protein isoform X3 [Scyliorhinus canicula]
MRWAEIAMGVSLLALLSRVCEGQEEGCPELETCERCIAGDASLNLTDCVWAHCQSETLCVSKTSDNLTDCTIHDEPSMCKAEEVSTTTEETATTTEIPTTAPVYSPSSFDPASFIGGIVLVLGAEAAFFFAIKFFKARDGTYQTLNEEAQ